MNNNWIHSRWSSLQGSVCFSVVRNGNGGWELCSPTKSPRGGLGGLSLKPWQSVLALCEHPTPPLSIPSHPLPSRLSPTLPHLTSPRSHTIAHLPTPSHFTSSHFTSRHLSTSPQGKGVDTLREGNFATH